MAKEAGGQIMLPNTDEELESFLDIGAGVAVVFLAMIVAVIFVTALFKL